MKHLAPLVAFAAMILGACGGGSSSPSSTPTQPPTAPPTPTPSPTLTVTPTPTPSPAPLSGSYTTSYQPSSATPFPASVPIQLFGQAQTAAITVSGGVSPYGGTLQFCTSGAGFGAPFTLVQGATNAVYTLTATQYAGSCTVTLFDSSPATRTLQIQATLTTTSGTVQ